MALTNWRVRNNPFPSVFSIASNAVQTVGVPATQTLLGLFTGWATGHIAPLLLTAALLAKPIYNITGRRGNLVRRGTMCLWKTVKWGYAKVTNAMPKPCDATLKVRSCKSKGKQYQNLRIRELKLRPPRSFRCGVGPWTLRKTMRRRNWVLFSTR